MFDGSHVNLLIALIGGVITFFASCLLPLVPTYLAFLAGIATSKTTPDKSVALHRRDIFVHGLLFTLGFITIFVLMGATSRGLGLLLNVYRPLVQKLGGVLFIIMGLFMLKVIQPTFLYRERKLITPESLTKFRKLNSFLVGLTFGFAWTPCIGPVLAVILFWASQAQTVWMGMSLLLAYGIGLGIPFLVVAFFFEAVADKLSVTSNVGKYLNLLAGLVIVLMGILLILNKVEFISVRLLQQLNLNTLAI